MTGASPRRAAIAITMATVIMLPPALPGLTAGALAAPDPQKELARLEKKAAALNKEYRGELIALNEARRAAQRAATEADRLERDLTAARTDVGRIAATSYMTGGIDPIPVVTSADPSAAIRDAAVVQHLARNNELRLQSAQALQVKAAQARKSSAAKVTEVRKQIEDLEKQRTRVRKLLAKYRPERPTVTRPDGASGSKSPVTGSSMTARMRTLMLAIDGRFGPFPTIGCFRGGAGAQDHGTGTACDFMESTGGRMPSASAQAHGDQVAQFAINNASQYGVKYIIWKQRIWDTRSGGGWRAMENRGGITANHFDHVHISVL
ncbi:hypothetical protein DPM19_32060 [Actinomadura craniellae]|uniref:ARB-07466-like C-terminal domain-containing protein n=1 Tax=Actinomadura craniellae TaxID=2231787 RepID=A0A365GWE4_9ACTN|nr:hypothetical protein [Actinomadura craniellae]RAY11140.1 hypothetical protein DPM19_32060 [Actinomadura craniellae]